MIFPNVEDFDTDECYDEDDYPPVSYYIDLEGDEQLDIKFVDEPVAKIWFELMPTPDGKIMDYWFYFMSPDEYVGEIDSTRTLSKVFASQQNADILKDFVDRAITHLYEVGQFIPFK